MRCGASSAAGEGCRWGGEDEIFSLLVLNKFA
jgi:hypothetical protein